MAWSVFAALMAAALAGWYAAAIGPVAGIAAVLARERLEVRAREERLRAQLVDGLRSLAGALRAGRSLPQALVEAHEDSPAPLRDALAPCVGGLASGLAVSDALAAFVGELPADVRGPVGLTLSVGRRSGGDLAFLLDRTATSLAERERLREERRAATAQARLSAIVIGLLPVAFALLSGRHGPLALLGTPAGRVVLAAGLALEVLGVLWVRRLIRQ